MKLNELKSLEFNGVLIPKRQERNIDTPKTRDLSYDAWIMFYKYSAINPELSCLHNKTFMKNFITCFNARMKLDGFLTGWEEYKSEVDYFRKEISRLKEEKKVYDKAHKEEIKKIKDEEKEKYGWCIVNGNKEPVASYFVEPEGIYFGRGESPITGMWKTNTTEEDITLNWISDKKPPKGNWNVENNPKLHCLATYDVKVGIPGQSPSYTATKMIALGAASSIKQESVSKKYESCSELAKYRDKMITSLKETLYKQFYPIHFGLYILLETGIRIGEKTTQNNTKGLLSLVYGEDVDLYGNLIHFHFYGKDSVFNDSSFLLDSKIAKNVVLEKGKPFIKATKSQIVDLAEKFLDGQHFTPKMARTMLAGCTMLEALKNAAELHNLSPESSDHEKLMAFNEANIEVAKKLNHQKGVEKSQEEKQKVKFNEQEEKLRLKIEKDKEKIKELEKKKEELKAQYSRCMNKSKKIELKEKISKLGERIEKIKTSDKNNREKFEFKKENKNLAAGTSKTSYIDPDIAKEWCDKYKLPIEKVYTKSQLKNFSQFFGE